VVDFGRGADPLRAAGAALEEAYAGPRVKPGKGLPHAHAVARVLANAGCSETVQVAGLLHDVVEDTSWTVDDVRDRFGTAVAELVTAVTEDDRISSYRPRKRALREQIQAAGPAAIDIALADKVASLGYALSSDSRVPKRKLAHYEATVALSAGAGHPQLARDAAALLAVVAARDDAVGAV
jgi:(p)ppGpp synthase/HD superfamily hydrolase